MPSIGRRPKKRHRLNQALENEDSLGSGDVYFNLDLNVSYNLNAYEEFVSIERKPAKYVEKVENKGSSDILKGINLNLDLNRNEAAAENNSSPEVNNMGANILFEEVNPKEREFDLNLNLSNDNQGEVSGGCVSSKDNANVSNVGCFEMDAHENNKSLGTISGTSNFGQSEHRRRGRPKGRRKSVESTCQTSNSAVVIPQLIPPTRDYDKQLRRITRSNATKLSNCPESSSITTCTMILPPSSKNPDLCGLPILDIFSVYACLRTFSMLLFLSPFEFEEFVESLRLDFSNALFDSIHVSVLRSFKKHLECLSLEGSVSATDCLRSLDWNLLDDATWPIFLVEYFVIHRLGSEPGLNLLELDFFKKGYHKLSVSVKIEVLRYLCDEMMEMETFRSEINKRSSGSEWESDIDRNGLSSISKRRRIDVDLSRASCLTDEAAEDSADWNSDECILCKMDGSLICCDGCPAAYHAKCVGVANESLPDGDWYCRECFAHKNKPWKKTYNLLTGAAFLGTDFTGQLYISCCGYLLVSDMLNSGNECKYYHRDDLMGPIEVLRTSMVSAWELLEVICRTFMIPIAMSGDSGILSSVDSKSRPELSFSEIYDSGILHELDVTKPEGLVNPISEGSDETTPKRTNELDNGFNVVPGSGTLKRIRGNSSMPSDFDTKNSFIYMGARSNALSKNIDGTPNRTDYVNYYSFGSTAASIVEDLMGKHRDMLSRDLILTEEEIISAQMKIIIRKFAGFCLPTSLSLPSDVLRQNCGWCFLCRAATAHNECLFNLEYGSFEESRARRENSNPIDSFDELKRSLVLLFGRLRGLLRDPFQDHFYSKQWLDCVKNASELNSFKPLLLKLEEYLHRGVLSSEWWRPADSVVTMGSACHFVVNFCGRKKKVRFSDVGSNPSSSNGGLNMLWWRGGRLSRHLFSWKLLPRSILTKAARLGGFSKLPGVFYPENSDPARRTKCTAWRASVESSFSVEHLTLQIREFDANIKWDEIWNIQASCMMDKGFKKSYRHFKKAMIRKKSKDGEGMKYLVDFGKRKAIPDIVSKNGFPAKDSSSDRQKYWLNESFVPLFLLKTFQLKKSSHTTHTESTPKKKEFASFELSPKTRKKKGLDYLLKKAESAQNIQCGHCHKDIIISEAVHCQYCKGSFHKRHVVRFGGTVPANVVYTCHRCNNGKSHKSSNKKKRPVGDKEKESSVRKSARLCGKRVCTFSNHKKRKRVTEHKKSVVPKNKKPRKARSVVSHNFWLKGILFSRKGDDKERLKFRKENVKDAECCICGHLGSFLCISCEFCGGWFHAHAFGLTKANMTNVIGFRCHLCRKCVPPICFPLPPTEPNIRSNV